MKRPPPAGTSAYSHKSATRGRTPIVQRHLFTRLGGQSLFLPLVHDEPLTPRVASESAPKKLRDFGLCWRRQACALH